MINVNKIKAMVLKPAVYIPAVVVASAGVGGFVGYRLAYKTATDAAQKEITEQVEAAKEYYSNLRVVEAAKPTPLQVMAEMKEKKELQFLLEQNLSDDEREEYQELLNQYSPPDPANIKLTPPKAEPAPAAESKSIFDNRSTVAEEDDLWNYEEEIPLRSQEISYPIHRDEFHENEMGYEQDELVWYEEDETLVDSRSAVVQDPEDKVGSRTLVLFGHGSGDNNIVFARNEELEMDFEIVRSDGSYAKEVLGFTDDNSLKHSSRRRKWDDD